MSILRPFRRSFWSIGIFSAIVNLLMLSPSIYMLQVYDRVLASGNGTTLLMLTLLIAGLGVFMAALEWVRSTVCRQARDSDRPTAESTGFQRRI